MGYKVKPGDSVKYKNKPIKPVNYVYILLNKPKDYLTTVDADTCDCCRLGFIVDIVTNFGMSR